MNEKEKGRLYTPAETSQILDLDRDLIRKYCEFFNVQTNWTQPNQKGHRRFTKENIEQLLEIKRLIQEEKLSWEQTRDFLNGEIEHFFEHKTRSELEKKIDALAKQQSEMFDEMNRRDELFLELLHRHEKILEENRMLAQRHDKLLTSTMNEKQEEKKSFFSRLFGS